MGKKVYNNYDDTVFGKYIRAIENPDSVGWDAAMRVWTAPEGKKHDSRNRGMGVDVVNNTKARKLTQNRPGQLLTEQEENQLRNEHIQYLLDVIDRRKKQTPALQNMPPKKQAQVLGILYRGDAGNLWNKNGILGKALLSEDTSDMDKAIQQYYNSINLGERARNDAAFWNQRNPKVPTPQFDYSEKPDVLGINNPYKTQVENSIIAPQMVPDDNSYVKAHKLTEAEDKQNKMREALDTERAYNILMKNTSLENTATQFEPKFKFSDGGFLKPKDSWEKLPLVEKAEMIKVAVNNGITDLQDIRNKYNEFAEGGREDVVVEGNTNVPFKQREEVIITPDTQYNQYLNTLPDNQRFTPNDKYDSYFYWKLNGRPKNFDEAYSKGMFHYDNSDKSYHANSIAFGKDGIGYFMKPKTHDTVGYELDWFNKGLITEEGGHQRYMTPEEKKEWLEFRKDYTLMNDPNRPNYYKYQPKKKAEGGEIHIDPSKKGTFTAAASKHGKSVQAFASQVLAHPENYSPAMVKKANFARNSRCWKHELGGNLFYPGGDVTYGQPWRWGNIMYDPLTPVESDFRKELNIGLKPKYRK